MSTAKHKAPRKWRTLGVSVQFSGEKYGKASFAEGTYVGQAISAETLYFRNLKSPVFSPDSNGAWSGHESLFCSQK
jgi:hypothetical protein